MQISNSIVFEGEFLGPILWILFYARVNKIIFKVQIVDIARVASTFLQLDASLGSKIQNFPFSNEINLFSSPKSFRNVPSSTHGVFLLYLDQIKLFCFVEDEETTSIAAHIYEQIKS